MQIALVMVMIMIDVILMRIACVRCVMSVWVFSVAVLTQHNTTHTPVSDEECIDVLILITAKPLPPSFPKETPDQTRQTRVRSNAFSNAQHS